MLTNQQIIDELKETDGWEIKEGPKQLTKKFEFKGNYKTMSFANAVAWLANKHNHHPELFITFNSCTIFLTTHDDGGVTTKDISMVREIEKLLL